MIRRQNSARSSYLALSCAALGAIAGGTAHAALLVYEPFPYAWASILPPQGACCGWATPWTGSTLMRIDHPTLTAPLALPSAGNAVWNHAVGEAWRDIGGGGVSNFPSDVWISFMERSIVAGSGAYVELLPLGAPTPSIIIDKDALGTVKLSSGGLSAIAGVSKGPGNTDFFVVHITQFSGTSTVSLYLNPAAITTTPSATLPAVPTSYLVSRFYLRTQQDQVLDEIRIGTNPGDVAAATGGGGGCYANCDGSTTAPVLNVADFTCFLQKYASGDPYANCDQSTTPPVLNVADFTCFLQQYAAGCP